ncbi:glycosyltransferase family 4 protein [Vibrio tapetis]|uniref:Glycosyltransferase n=1 Tax=Vibrio tapetis subsp. tapetis TaxID=1671868 RepID=A0A2N8ZMJ3_9VIBR|nr:glycosyltransferase family 4 protein [Vibrio tapetis]SON53125.1 Glycosyltransferase [Vibrio tapetis subsp. tapetis]
MTLSKRDRHLPKENEIWLLIDSLTFGGIETHVLELSYGLSQFGHSVRVVFVTQYDHASPLVDRLQMANIQYSYLYQISGSPKRLNPLRALSRAVRIHRPKLLHAHGYKASILSKLVKLAPSGRTINQFTTFHAGESPTGKVRLYDAIDRYSAFISQANFAVSQLVQDKVQSTSIVLNNFISTDKLHLSEGEQIAFVGRLSREKGPDRFVNLAGQFPYLEFHIYGSGPMETELLDRGEPNIVYHGHQNNMSKVWESVGILVISSRFEGLPMAALEAMARGIPVVAMNVGALSTLITHGTNGWIANSPEELSACLMEWLQMSPSQQHEVAINACNTVTHSYSSQAVIPQILHHYHLES